MANTFIYISILMTIVVIVLVVTYTMLIAPTQDKKLDELSENREFWKKSYVESSSLNKKNDEDLKESNYLERMKLDETYRSGWFTGGSSIHDKDKNCLEINGTELSFSECKNGSENQKFTYFKDVLSSNNNDLCFSDAEGKIVMSDECYTGGDPFQWNYTAFPLFQYKNKKSGNCLKKIDGTLGTSACDGNDENQKFTRTDQERVTRYNTFYKDEIEAAKKDIGTPGWNGNME